MEETIKLKWTRPELMDFPKIWHTFKAKDTDSDELIEYRIQDIPDSRKEEAVHCMVQQFSRDEPLCDAYELFNDPTAIEDFNIMWQAIVDQNAALVCFKEGSDEIVGINMNFVSLKDDHFMEEIRKRNKSTKINIMFDIILLLYKNFDTCQHYGVDKYLTSLGLIVVEKYRGRGIGEQFLKTRKEFCNAYGIKLTSTIFTSNFSNRIADKIGFKLNKTYSYTDIRHDHPEFKLPPIESQSLTLKSIVF